MSAATLALPAMRSSESDALSNAIAPSARLPEGTVLFVVMGPLLGPAAFGEFMSAMAVASLIAFGSNLGFTQHALSEVAAHRAETARIAPVKATLVGPVAVGQQAIRSMVNIIVLTLSVALIVASIALGRSLVGVVALICLSALFVLGLYRWRVRMLGGDA